LAAGDDQHLEVERVLLEFQHRPIRNSDRRFHALRKAYREYRAAHNGRKPLYLHQAGHRWTPLPLEFGP
jgi:citrate synthase